MRPAGGDGGDAGPSGAPPSPWDVPCAEPERVELVELEEVEGRGFCSQCGALLLDRVAVGLAFGTVGDPKPQLFCDDDCRGLYLRALRSHPAWDVAVSRGRP